MKLFWTFIFCLSLISGIAGSALAQEEETFGTLGAVKVLGDAPSSLNLGLGGFDVFDADDSVAAQVEWRFGDKLGFVGPLAGVVANADGGVFGYLGLYTDFSVGDFVITPHTGFGAYEKGNGNDLGGVFEFYSSLTVAYRLENRSLVGIRFGHISNADLHDSNPGTDLLLAQYRIYF